MTIDTSAIAFTLRMQYREALRMQYRAGGWRRSQFNLGHDVSGCLPKAKVFNMAIALGQLEKPGF